MRSCFGWSNNLLCYLWMCNGAYEEFFATTPRNEPKEACGPLIWNPVFISLHKNLTRIQVQQFCQIKTPCNLMDISIRPILIEPGPWSISRSAVSISGWSGKLSSGWSSFSVGSGGTCRFSWIWSSYSPSCSSTSMSCCSNSKFRSCLGLFSISSWNKVTLYLNKESNHVRRWHASIRFQLSHKYEHFLTWSRISEPNGQWPPTVHLVWHGL